jgi:dienelactone hydrolase
VDGAVTLSVSPRRAPLDEPVAIRVSRVAPRAGVTLRARVRSWDGGLWASAAAFRADADGVVDLERDAPVDGAYAGPDPTGLLWSMQPAGDPGPPLAVTAPLLVQLEAEVGGETVASAAVERQVVADGLVVREVRDRGLVGRLFRPAEGGPAPAVVVLSGSAGGMPTLQAAVLARHGFAALALAYFAVEAPASIPPAVSLEYPADAAGALPPSLRAVPLEYFADAFEWLTAQPGVRRDAVGLIGGSRGGELVLLLGATYPLVRAVVAYAPSHVGWVGIGPAEERGPAAWTLAGQPVPWNAAWDAAKAALPGPIPGVPFSITPVFLAALEDREAEARAAIPVERIAGRVLLISGREDAVWPSTLMADRVVQRMAAHGRADRVEHLAYDGAGHLIVLPHLPATVTVNAHAVTKVVQAYGGHPRGIARAQADSWPRVIAFLTESLAGDAGVPRVS